MYIPVALFFIVFYFYLRTHCATFNINDSGETIMVCDLLTISHSPGYPLHTLWGRVNCLLPIGKPMFRVTFCSLITGTISVTVIYLTLKMMFRGIFAPSETSTDSADIKQGAWIWQVPALFGALIFAFSYQHWFQSGGAKGGIYTLNTLMSVCMLFLFFKMKENGWFIKSFLLMGFLYGLSLAHHWPNQLVLAPAYFWLIVNNQTKTPLIDIHRWFIHPAYLISVGVIACFSFAIKFLISFSFVEALKVFATALFIILALSIFVWSVAVVLRFLGGIFVLCTAIGMLFVVFLSMGIAHRLIPLPVLGSGLVIFLVSAILIRIFNFKYYLHAFVLGFLSLSIYIYLPIRATQDPLVNWWNPQTLNRLVGTVLREGYKGIGDVRSWTTIIRNWERFWMHAQHQFGDIFTYLVLVLAAWGFYWLFRKKQWAAGIGFLAFGGGVFMGVMLFNNPLEGYQWTLDNFFSPVFLMISIYAAAGIASICEWAIREWPERRTALYTTSFCLGFALMPLTLNYKATESIAPNGQSTYKGADQSRYVSSYDEGMNMLKTVNDDAVILCNGDIDILPLWYLQYVEGKRPKVVSFTMQLIPYDWYREPLFKRSPFLRVPVGQDIRPETVVQNMIEQHKNERSFYFTNIFTAPWMREKNAAIPDGFVWRMVNTKNLNYPFTTQRLNGLWSTYRLRDMDVPDRGYWDEYTDVMKDSYGIGHDFTGYFAFMNKMPDLALWSFGNALKFRQPQTLVRIYMMLGETYMALGDPGAAINNYQETLRRDPRNPYVYAKVGDAFLAMRNYPDAEAAYRQALALNPQQGEAVTGLQELNKVRGIRGEPGDQPKR